MAIDYNRMRSTATRLLTQNGTQFLLERAGTVTRDDFGKEISTPTETLLITGVITDYSIREVDGALVQTTDRLLTATSDIEIKVDDRVDVDGKMLRVVKLERIKPSTVLIGYRAQLRA